MKKERSFLVNILRRVVVVIMLLLMALTAYSQYSGMEISPEGIFSKIISPAQEVVSKITQAVEGYLRRVKLRSNIEYEYNQLKAQNDELILRSILYEELEEENTQLRAMLGEYEERATMKPVLARVSASESGN